MSQLHGSRAKCQTCERGSRPRRLALKRRDGGVDYVLLVLAATRGNRAAFRETGAALAPDLPVVGRDAITALSAGQDPGGHAIVLI